MATTVDWLLRKINIPRADMALLQASPEVRGINVNDLRGEVGTLAASAQGAPWSTAFLHNGEVTISGVVYARQITFLYEVIFEDGQYTVIPEGANHNLADVAFANQVRMVVNNSAGLISLASSRGLVV